MCWGPDIEAVHRVNQDRLRALAQQMWNRGANSMCDYSLMHVKSRPASVGDKLRTTNFGTGTRGFAAARDLGRVARGDGGTALGASGRVEAVETECALCDGDGRLGQAREGRDSLEAD